MGCQQFVNNKTTPVVVWTFFNVPTEPNNNSLTYPLLLDFTRNFDNNTKKLSLNINVALFWLLICFAIIVAVTLQYGFSANWLSQTHSKCLHSRTFIVLSPLGKPSTIYTTSSVIFILPSCSIIEHFLRSNASTRAYPNLWEYLFILKANTVPSPVFSPSYLLPG